LGLHELEVVAYQTNEQRVKNRPDLKLLLQSKIGMLTSQNFITALRIGNIPYGIVKDMKEVFETSEAQKLLMHSHDRTGVRSYVASDSHSSFPHFLPPPHLGEHTQEILLQTLEFTPESIKAMAERGIIA